MGAFALAAAAVLFLAQEPRATVAGEVRDAASGRPLAGASVVLPDLGRATATDDAGRYRVRDVPPGPQHVVVRLIGHAPRTLHALVPAGGVLRLDVTLRPQPVRLAPMEVRAAVRLPGLEPGPAAFPDRSLSAAALRNHPLLAEPDPFQVFSGGEVVIRPESPGGVHIRGGAAEHTGFLLDGIPVLSPYHAAGVFSAWNPDALARLELAAAEPPLASSAALSGVIAGVTRDPGPRFGAQGSISTTQARLVLDGPLGPDGAGILLAARLGFPGALSPKSEPSYVQGTTGDGLATLRFGLLGGGLEVLGYQAENELDAAAAASVDGEAGPPPPRHRFAWGSRSLGGTWRRALPAGEARLVAWHASTDADAVWAADSGGAVLDAARRDLGFLAALAIGSRRGTAAPVGHGATEVGFRYERIRTTYRVTPDPAASGPWRAAATTPVVTAFARHARPVGARGDAVLGASVAAADGSLHVGARAGAGWRPAAPLRLSASFARTHQFAQSLRHSESVVGTLFPADLFVGAAVPGVPVARSDQGVAALEFRPAPGFRVGAQAYLRDFDGLVLAAPRASQPFATGEFVVGGGTARGVAVDAAFSTARLGVVASWGLQRVRFAYADSAWVPEHGTRHLLEGGVTWFPTTTTSLRLGLAGAFGRRTTTASGAFEWEACNLLDEGCEFGGSPTYGSDPLGGTRPPGYYRVDLGIRQHWHHRIAGHDVLLGLFATASNLFGRTNVLTFVRDPVSGETTPVEMRPRAPLVVGLDWRF